MTRQDMIDSLHRVLGLLPPRPGPDASIDYMVRKELRDVIDALQMDELAAERLKRLTGRQ